MDNSQSSTGGLEFSPGSPQRPVYKNFRADLRKGRFSTVSTAPTTTTQEITHHRQKARGLRTFLWITSPRGQTSNLPLSDRGAILIRGSKRSGHESPDHVRTVEARPVKFRVERDVLAEAVAWTAKSLPARPPAPVLAGLLLSAIGERAGHQRLRLRGLGPRRSCRRRSRRRARSWSPASCSPTSPAPCRTGRWSSPPTDPRSSWCAAAPGSPCRPCRWRSTRRCRTCPRPRAASRPATFAAAVAQVAVAAGQGRHPAVPDRRPGGDRRATRCAWSPPTATGWPCARSCGSRRSPTSTPSRWSRPGPCTRSPARSPAASSSPSRWPTADAEAGRA